MINNSVFSRDSETLLQDEENKEDLVLYLFQMHIIFSHI